MKTVSTLLCLLCIGVVDVSPAIEHLTNEQVLMQSDLIEQPLVKSSLHNENPTSEKTNPEMGILERMHYHNVPGMSIAFVNKGKIALASGYGNITDDKSSKAVDEHTLFQAASVSKPLTAYGALLLVQQGKIDLDEDVNTYLRSWKIPENEFTQTEKVTLRRLLSHTAGTSVHGFDGYSRTAYVPTTIEVLDGVKPLVNTDPVRVIMQPGAQFQYSGGGTTIVQLLIEDITGEKFDDWMETNVLNPLGMFESTFSHPLSLAHADRVAYGYLKDGKMQEWLIYPEKAAAGLWSTPTDLAKFILHIQETLMSNKAVLLNPSLVQEMITEQFPLEDGNAVGLGFFISRYKEGVLFTHSGHNYGFISIFCGFANHAQGMVIMMNSDEVGDLVNEIKNIFDETYN